MPGGEASQPGHPRDRATVSLPAPGSSTSSWQVPPPAGGDAHQELQRAGRLLLPAAHLPAAAAA